MWFQVPTAKQPWREDARMLTEQAWLKGQWNQQLLPICFHASDKSWPYSETLCSGINSFSPRKDWTNHLAALCEWISDISSLQQPFSLSELLKILSLFLTPLINWCTTADSRPRCFLSRKEKHFSFHVTFCRWLHSLCKLQVHT